MKANKNIITVYEHQRLKVGATVNGVEFKDKHLIALETHYGNGELNYYKLINKGVQFNQHVGVLRVGELTIEVLPKADKNNDESIDTKVHWRSLLIGMLKTVGAFNVQAPSSASLSIKTNFILDLYFELFVKEVEYLLNLGLVKQYRKTEGQSLALKGSLQFGKHIAKNLVHQERFYVRYNTYSYQQTLNQILLKTLNLLKRINHNPALQSRICSLLLHFPEINDLRVTDSTFEKIHYNRKTTCYKNAIEISRLLLLNYHPDVSSGRNNILAIMFDMNALWERFVYVSLRKQFKGKSISAQATKRFWESKDADEKSSMRPDIVMTDNKTKESIVLDTKWKNIQSTNISPSDLRQMYVYHEYFDANKVALVYPGEECTINSGHYMKKSIEDDDKECSVITIKVGNESEKWNINYNNEVGRWLEASIKN